MFDFELSGHNEIIADFGESPRSVDRAIVRALNRSIGSGRTVMTRAIAADLGLRAKDVRDKIRLTEATQTRPEASIGASLKRIPLINFRARGSEPSRGKGRGVTYRIGAVTGRIESGFIATMSSGHRGVFERKNAAGSTRKSRGAWGPNLPIKEKFGPSLGRVFGKYRPAGIARVREQFLKNFGHELRFERGFGGTGTGAPATGAGDGGAE